MLRKTLLAATALVAVAAPLAVTAHADAAIPDAPYCATRAEGAQIKLGMTARQVRHILDGQEPWSSQRGVGGDTGRKLWFQVYWGCGSKDMIVGYTRGITHHVVRASDGSVGVIWS